jgi:hypothetical protein
MKLSEYIPFLQDFQKGRDDDPEVYTPVGRANECRIFTTIDGNEILLLSSLDHALGVPLPELKR